MSRSAQSSASRRYLSGGDSTDLFGFETGLPMIQCPECGRQRVFERRSNKPNANVGRVYIKCPFATGVPGCCTFYRWQKDYLRHLVENDISIGDQWQEDEEVGKEIQEDAGSVRPMGGGNLDESQRVLVVKVDELVRAVKMLVVLLVCVVVVAVSYVLK